MHPYHLARNEANFVAPTTECRYSVVTCRRAAAEVGGSENLCAPDQLAQIQ